MALGSALVHDPELLILDEPTVGIDPLLRAQVWTELRRLRDAGRTLLVTTQYVTEAESCDLVALIAGGRLVALDTPDALRRRATGGEVIEIETSGTFDVDALHDIEGVRAVRQLGLRTHAGRRRRRRPGDAAHPQCHRRGRCDRRVVARVAPDL